MGKYAEKIIEEKIGNLDSILRVDNTKSASSIIDILANQIDHYCEFTKGIGSVQKWVEKNRIIRGKPFQYNNADIEMMLGEKDNKLKIAQRPYLIQYLNDNCKDKTVIKCRQSEFSENEINENLYLCVSRPYTNVRHIFPTSGMANKMAREKISVAIDESPSIKESIKKPYNLTVKAFKNSSFYTIDSSWTDYQGRGPSSDKITFDEYESQNPQIEDIYSESTSHSEIGRRVRISTPKFPDSGIDGRNKKGCQYEWYITCPKCKKEQMMEFPDNLIGFFDIGNIDIESKEYVEKLNKVYIGCKFCGEYIDKTNEYYIKTSRWIALKPHLVYDRASYRVTYMMLPWKTGKEILYKYHSFKFIHQFWNEIMGFAYISPEARISREVFEQCQDKSFSNLYQRIGQAKNISIGVDWGEVSWVVVRANGFPPEERKPRVIYIERIDSPSLQKLGYQGRQTDHVKRVDEIMGFFNASIIVNDANGIGVDRNSYLVRKYPTKAWGCFYDTEEIDRQRKKERLIIPQFVESSRKVTVSRLSTLKLMIQEYEEKRVSIPRLDNNIEEFIKHHASLAIERYQDEKTEAIYEIVGHVGPDHFAQADNYARIGFEKIFNTYRESSAGVINPQTTKHLNTIEEIHPLLR